MRLISPILSTILTTTLFSSLLVLAPTAANAETPEEVNYTSAPTETALVEDSSNIATADIPALDELQQVASAKANNQSTAATFKAESTRQLEVPYFSFEGGYISIYGTGKSTISANIKAKIPAKVSFSATFYKNTQLKGLFKASLQTKTSKGWVDTGLTYKSSDDLDFKITLPALSKNSNTKNKTVYYRLKSDPDQAEQYISKSIKVNYVNPKLYTGTKKKIYSYMSKYCPMAIVSITKLQKGRAGEYTTGTYTIKVASNAKNWSSKNQKTVALHECGHLLQWDNYGGTMYGWGKVTKEAAKIFKHKDPIEHMADCIARAAYKNSYMGYGGSCSSKEIRYAKKALAGKRLL